LVRWSVKHFSIWNVGVNNSPVLPENHIRT
jgi:hypothetical protein